MLHESLISAALEEGARSAVVIRAEDIVLNASFRDICRGNGCGMYGRCWMCPPDIGEIDTLISRVKGFSYGLLYQTVSDIEDSFDFEGMTEAGLRHAQLSQRLEAAVKPLLQAHLHLSCGGCRLCARCAKMDGLPCRHPDRALPSMEGYGIDVCSTVRPTGLQYINGENTVTYFGVVLFGREESAWPN